MLGKLIKHEFRATSLFCGLLFAGLIALAALSRLFMLLERQLQLFSLPLGITFGLYWPAPPSAYSPRKVSPRAVLCFSVYQNGIFCSMGFSYFFLTFL